ncbi:unnamed protein product [Amoebophrya sp. A25]|nr:unnamed protein product [Amoebophrya sp. A25]|eukprot:GSA25T00023366001.1
MFSALLFPPQSLLRHQGSQQIQIKEDVRMVNTREERDTMLMMSISFFVLKHFSHFILILLLCSCEESCFGLENAREKRTLSILRQRLRCPAETETETDGPTYSQAPEVKMDSVPFGYGTGELYKAKGRGRQARGRGNKDDHDVNSGVETKRVVDDIVGETGNSSLPRLEILPQQPLDALNALFFHHGSDRGFITHMYGDSYHLLFDSFVTNIEGNSLVRRGRCGIRRILEVGLGTVEKDEPSSMHWWKAGAAAKYMPGASLEVWREYFQNAELIVGLDVSSSAVALARKRLEGHTFIQVARASSFVPGDVRNAFEELGLLATQKNEESSRESNYEPTGNLLFDAILDDGLHSIPAMTATLLTLWPFLNPSGGLYVIEDIRFEDVQPLMWSLQHFFFRRRVRMWTFVSPFGTAAMIALRKEGVENSPQLLYSPQVLDHVFGGRGIKEGHVFEVAVEGEGDVIEGNEKVVKISQQGDGGHQEIEAIGDSQRQGDVGQGHENPNDFHVGRAVRDHIDEDGSKTGNANASSSTASRGHHHVGIAPAIFSEQNTEKDNKGSNTNTSSTSTSLIMPGPSAISRRPLREVQQADVETIRSLFGLKALRMLRERWWLPLRTFMSQLDSPGNFITWKFTNATPSSSSTSTSYAVHVSRWFGQLAIKEDDMNE